MTTSLTKRFFAISAGLAIAALATPLSAQQHGESIVGMQIVSDTAAQPTQQHTFVGDMAPVDAGVTYDSGTSTPGEVVFEDGAVFGSSCQGAGCQQRKYSQQDLFYNYYSQGNCNRANAQMYVSPVPVPPFVGHTFYTYQPFYPHHYLYQHRDRYHNYYDNGRGTNRTRATYSTPIVRQTLSNLYWNKIRLPR